MPETSSSDGGSLTKLREAEGLSHLVRSLQGQTLRGLVSAMMDDRAALLQVLKTECSVVKLGDRQRLLNMLARHADTARRQPDVMGTASVTSVATVDGNRTRGGTGPPRVAFVCHTGYFAGGSFGGATRASLAMLREARRICGEAAAGGGIDVIALVQVPVPEALVFKLEHEQLAELEWDGERVLVGRPSVLQAALKGRTYDVVVSLSIEYTILSFAMGLQAIVRYATPHNYYLPPFGPFSRFRGREGHSTLLLQQDALLSPCEHHCEYLRRWGPPGIVARPLYAADYHYFHSVAEGDASCLPPAMSPWEPSHRYVTLVSPAPEKGLAIFVALARRLPDVAFAAVTTQWASKQTVAQLQRLPNVTILAAHPDVDVLFRQTKVLLAPSLWQECCPLIVMESCLRGIPCISSDVFGLPEANSNARLVVHASLSYDHAR